MLLHSMFPTHESSLDPHTHFHTQTFTNIFAQFFLCYSHESLHDVSLLKNDKEMKD